MATAEKLKDLTKDSEVIMVAPSIAADPSTAADPGKQASPGSPPGRIRIPGWRILAATGVVVAIHFGFLVVHQRGDVVMPERSVGELPQQIGPWQGQDMDVPPQVFEAIGADVVLDRVYSNPAKEQISLHMALFADYYRELPHHPQVCYEANGHSLVEKRVIELPTGDGRTVPACLMIWEHDGARSQTIHWYQLGDQVLLEKPDLRPACQRMREQQDWPPLVKVLLHTAADDPATGEARLKSFGTPVRDWVVKNLAHPPGAGR